MHTWTHGLSTPHFGITHLYSAGVCRWKSAPAFHVDVAYEPRLDESLRPPTNVYLFGLQMPRSDASSVVHNYTSAYTNTRARVY